MTRINAGIPPRQLHYKHLLAELREIKRIPKLLRKANFDNLPDKFCLGTGHVRFFYNKGLYTHKRYIQLYNEAISRKYNVQDFSESWDVYKLKKFEHLYNGWRPTAETKKLITKRIKERLQKMNNV